MLLLSQERAKEQPTRVRSVSAPNPNTNIRHCEGLSIPRYRYLGRKPRRRKCVSLPVTGRSILPDLVADPWTRSARSSWSQIMPSFQSKSPRADDFSQIFEKQALVLSKQLGRREQNFKFQSLLLSSIYMAPQNVLKAGSNRPRGSPVSAINSTWE
jgi:hypothetical protein